MNALDPAHAGLASGINNAVSRAAGLLAIALLGIVMNRAFGHALDRQVRVLQLPPAVTAQLDAQRQKLAAISLPPAVPAAQRRLAQQAVAASFVTGFRWVMAGSALLAVCSALFAWLMIRTPGRDS
jgi:tRNA A37 threonylcarbamoyltransferase TsaD